MVQSGTEAELGSSLTLTKPSECNEDGRKLLSTLYDKEYDKMVASFTIGTRRSATIIYTAEIARQHLIKLVIRNSCKLL